MKKTSSSLARLATSGVLALALIFGAFAPTVAAAEKGVSSITKSELFSPDDGVVNYLAIGDSMANGYGMPGYYPNDEEGVLETEKELNANRGDRRGYNMNAENTWPSLVKESLENDGYNVELKNLSIAGMRVDDLMSFLVPEAGRDAYTEYTYLTGGYHGGVLCNATSCETCLANPDPKCEGGLNAVRDDYYSAIKAADLVSISLGMNNYVAILTNKVHCLLGTGGDERIEAINFGDTITDPEQLMLYQRSKAMLIDYFKDALGDFATEFTVSAVDILAYGISGFIQNYQKLYHLIRENNPNTKIVFLGLSNPIENMTLALGENTVNVASLVEVITDFSNTYIATLGRDDVYFASVEALDTMLDTLARGEINPIFAAKLVGDRFIAGNMPQEVQREFIRFAIADEKTKEEIKASIPSIKKADTSYGAAYESFIKLFEAIVKAAGDLNVSGEAVLEILGGGDTSAIYTDPYSDMAQDFLQIMTRLIFAEGIGAHVSETGHVHFANAVIYSLNNGYTGISHVKDEIKRVYNYVIRNDVYSPYLPNSQTSFYVALGDSATAASGSYADILAEYYNIDYTNYSKADATLRDILAIIKENEDVIAAADLITLNKNNSEAIQFMLSGKFGLQDFVWETLFDEAEAQYVKGLIADTRLSLRAKLPELSDDMFETLFGYLEAYVYAHVTQMLYLPKVTSALREIAPNALIVVVGSYNTFDGLYLPIGEKNIDIGKYIGIVTDILNLEALCVVLNDSNSAYVGIPDTKTVFAEELEENNENPALNLINAALYGKLLPSKDGQAYIAERIIEALSFVCDHEYDNNCDSECNICGEIRVPSDHVYKNACDADCDVCGVQRLPSPHEYAYECDESCNVCNQIREAAAHEYGEWVNYRQPTLQSTGVKLRTCSVCGNVESEILPTLKLAAYNGERDAGLGVGAVIAIAIAACALALIVGFCIFWFAIRKKSFDDLLWYISKLSSKSKKK